MIFDFLLLCFATSVLGITIILLELCWEMHKEIRSGNIELPLVKKKEQDDDCD